MKDFNNGLTWVTADMSKKKLLDKIVVVDLEATCWDGPVPGGQVSEIIEIGVCLMDIKTGERSDKRSLITFPTLSTISDFCRGLTGITSEKISKEGILLKDAFDILDRDYKSKNRVWASYGDYDRKMVYEACRQFNHVYPFGLRHINIKTQIAIKKKWNKEKGMARVLTDLEMPLEGRHHCGADDAWNSAAILWKVFE